MAPLPALLQQTRVAVFDHQFEALRGDGGIPADPFLPVSGLEGGAGTLQRANPYAVPSHNETHEIADSHGILKVMLCCKSVSNRSIS